MTKQNLYRLCSVFSEGELSLLEDALNAYLETGGFSDRILVMLVDLRDNIVLARRMVHQFGKSQH